MDKELPEVNIGVLGHVSHGKCVRIDTPILLNNEILTGKELLTDIPNFKDEVYLENDKIRTYTLDDNWEIYVGEAKRFFQRYSGKLVKITTSNGREVEVSPDHPLLVHENGRCEWRRASEIKEGDEVFVLGKINLNSNIQEAQKKIDFEENIKEFCRIIEKDEEFYKIVFKNGKKAKVKGFRLDENFVKLLAFINAEGHVGKRLMLTQKEEKEMLNEVLEYLSSLGYSFHLENGKDYIIQPKIAFYYFKKILGGSSKSLKGWFLYLPKDLKKTYLKWFFSLDGHINLKARGIELSQVSQTLVNFILISLYEFGIFPKIYKKKVKGKEYFRLALYGKEAEKFLKEIGLEGKKKLKALQLLELFENHKTRMKTYDSIKMDKENIKRLTFLLINDKRKGDGFKKQKIYKAIEEARKKGRITYELLERVIELVEERIKFLDNLKDEELENFVPLRKVALINNIPPTSFSRMVKRKDKKALALLRNYLNEKIKEAKEEMRKIETLYFGSLRVEKVKKVEYEEVKDEIIFDLSVSQTHTFFGGLGFFLLHNTVLVQALTGKLTLQHSEELKRGITIKLGYADATIYKCPQCGRYSNSKKCPFCFADTEIQRTVSFVDSPGHEILTATVLTGAGVIDGALLVIAANEKCPQPQTFEHLKALEIVGIDKIVIVQTKIDTVTKEQALKNYQEIKEFVKGTIAENAPIIPVSSTQRVNIDKVFEAIEKYIPTPKRDETKNPKFLVIRSFDVNKPGTEIDKIVGGILGGSVVEGRLKVGDNIEIKPGIKIENKYQPLETEVVGLRKANKDIREAGPGGLLGVSTKLDPSLTKADSLVGSVVGLKGTLPKETYEISFEYFEFERVYGAKEIQALPLIKIGEKILIHLANQRSVGIVKEARKNFISCQLAIPLIFEKGGKTKIAISRQVSGRWRLVGYGILL